MPMLDVAIVGAGPVGLYLGALLLQEGLSVRILEQRAAAGTHSRAIGIHPPGLDALARAGVAPQLLAEGLRITSGAGYSAGKRVTELRFDRLGNAYPFILSLPQARTEAILAARVHALDPHAVQRAVTVTAVHDAGDSLTLSTAHHRGSVAARLVVGADGARSTLRAQLGIATRGRDYPDNFLMGDFVDTGSHGPAAVLYLEPGGIVESFPLPGGLRRWVAHTPHFHPDADADFLTALIAERTAVAVDPRSNSMLSAFKVRSRHATRMVAGRAALIGDAAHEISPIGGQGMTLGWLDAAALAPIMAAALRGEDTGARLREFQRSRQRAAAQASAQAWLNTALGRRQPASLLALRHRLAGAALDHPRIHDAVARRFSMAPWQGPRIP